MPLNFPSNEEDLPPLHTDKSFLDVRSIEDVDESARMDTWYTQFTQTFNNPIGVDKIHTLIMDFMITEGFSEVAKALAKEANIEYNPEAIRDPCHLSERNSIRDSLQKGDIEKAIEGINQLCPGLLEKNKQLHFQILRQQLVELIRNKDIGAALQFAQQHLVDIGDQSREEMDKLEQTYALLAFDRPEESPFGKLMRKEQRLVLASTLNEAIITEMNSQPMSRLQQLMRLMVWNRNQAMMRGDVNNPPHSQTTNRIAIELFASRSPMEDDLLMEESL